MRKATGTKTVFFLILLLAIFVAETGFAAGAKVGLTIPLTGPYARQGNEQLDAYKLAIKEVNNQGGLLGGQVTFDVGNTQSKPDAAVAVARKLISEGAVMLSGGSSSSVAVAISAECQRSGILFFAGLTNANQTTGKGAHRHTFRWYNSSYQSVKGLSKTLMDRFGKNARYAHIYADYSWGKDVTETMRGLLEPLGANTVYVAATPLGSKAEFAATAIKQRLGYLLKLEEAAKTNPDILVCTQFGSDLVAILQQAKKLKLHEKMTLVAPIMELNVAVEAGPEAIEGVITSMSWYHGLSERYDGSRKFVQAFEREYGRKPGNSAATAYVDIMVWADAVRRVGTTDATKLIPAIEGHRFTLLTDEEYFRTWDHQGIHKVIVAEGKRPTGNSMDYFNIIDIIDGEETVRTREENPVQLELLPGETAGSPGNTSEKPLSMESSGPAVNPVGKGTRN